MTKANAIENPVGENSIGRSTGSKTLGLVIALVVCFAASGIGAAATTANLADWYQGINKPTWNPPNWIFGPVWTLLFAMMSVSVWLVWCKAGWMRAKAAMACFAVQLVLNVLWSVLFFGMQQPFWAACEIVVLWIAIAMTIVLFKRHSKLAAGLLVPYLLWVSFASVLNWTIWTLN